MDVSAFAKRKQLAIAAHATQVDNAELVTMATNSSRCSSAPSTTSVPGVDDETTGDEH